MPIRALCSISLIYVTRMLGLFMVLPVIMLLGQDYAGATATTLGMALGIYGLTQAGLQIPLGVLSDVVGRRPVLLLGLLVFVVGSVVAALADSVTGLIIGRALQGAGAISSTLLALLADLTPVQHRTRALAVVGISIGLSFSLAMVVGPLVGDTWGLPGIFMLTSGLALLSLLLVLTLPEPARRSRDGYQRWQPAELAAVLRAPGLWVLNVGIFCLHAVLASLFLMVPERLSALGYGLAQQGLVYLVMAVLALLALGPMMGQSERRHRPKAMLLFAQALVAGAMLLLPFGLGHWWLTLLALLLFFVGFNFLEASLPSWLSRLAAPHQRGTAMGVFSTAQFLGAALGGTLGGLSLDTGGSALLVSCALLFLSVWFILTGLMAPPPLSRQIVVPASDLTERSSVDHTSLRQWAEQLAALDGVLDVHIMDDESAVLLRVSRHEFDEVAFQAARQSATQPLGNTE
ncbi:MAG: MFS transporter [Natronospirillum sp.]